MHVSMQWHVTQTTEAHRRKPGSNVVPLNALLFRHLSPKATTESERNKPAHQTDIFPATSVILGVCAFRSGFAPNDEHIIVAVWLVERAWLTAHSPIKTCGQNPDLNQLTASCRGPRDRGPRDRGPRRRGPHCGPQPRTGSTILLPPLLHFAEGCLLNASTCQLAGR